MAVVSYPRAILVAVLALSLAVLLVQALAGQPRLWPAGAGLALSGDTVMGPLAAPRPVAVIRPPDLGAALAGPVVVDAVRPGGPAARAGLRPGQAITRVAVGDGPALMMPGGRFADGASALRVWRAMLSAAPGAPVALGVIDGDLPAPPGGAARTSAVRAPAGERTVVLERPPVWAAPDVLGPWLRRALGPLVQTLAFLAGAAALVALGTEGATAALMTGALVATAVANTGVLVGATAIVPLAGPLLVLFNWLVTPLAFPVIGLAVLYFPHRAEVLDRHRWLLPALAVAPMPMLGVSLVSAAFLLGADAVLPALVWCAERTWLFDASFSVALAANVLIVVEGIGRYRRTTDANERRRIQLVVFTGVPAVFAYAVKTGVPLLTGLGGRPVELPWPLDALLQALVLLPAVGLPYVVAVRHVFSPRTVLRRSLQYAFARRTLTMLTSLPAGMLAVSLVDQRERSLAAIATGWPMFYLVLAGLGWRYRNAAQRWLDRQFFRAEYDAREVLLSLATRVPYVADPRELVDTVVSSVDSAIHPESIVVLAGEGPAAGSGARLPAFTVVSSLHVSPAPLPADSAILTLLRWSDRPLDVYLDDERSPIARAPAADRAWLTAARAALLVPIFTGGSDPRPLVGLIALGPKRSDEPYTREDHELLRGIALQMGVALDLSRLRQEKSDFPSPVSDSAPTVLRPPARTAASIGAGVVIDDKYRVDDAVGQGGMGAVYRAWDLRLERPVAIKIVRPDMMADAESRARFRREAQIVARLQHPAIVTVFDYGALEDGAAFLVMEFVQGEDLRRLMRREGPLPLEDTVALLQGIAGGVEAAHQAGILHRDLKPENILLPSSGVGPKVVDFGVAKVTATSEGGTLTVGGTIVGTPAYMAPEQLRGSAVDARADVFSLGAMTYEMLLGRLPYGTGSVVDIGLRQAAGESAVDTRGLSPALGRVILRAIAYDPEKRPASPAAFVRDLADAR